MPTYYDEKTKTWFCQFRYTDSNGNKKQKRKRGFKTKKEAKEFERDFLATQQQSLEMKFSQFLVLYNEDMSTRLKPKTILVKEYIIKKHILPYFENKKMNKKMVTNKMSSYGRSKRVKREKWANRMAVLGVTMVVICLAAAVNAKGSTLKKSNLDYQQKEQQLEAQLRDEEERTKKLEEYKVYVKTKQFAEEVAKEKLGLVNPDEILLKPNK